MANVEFEPLHCGGCEQCGNHMVLYIHINYKHRQYGNIPMALSEIVHSSRVFSVPALGRALAPCPRTLEKGTGEKVKMIATAPTKTSNAPTNALNKHTPNSGKFAR